MGVNEGDVEAQGGGVGAVGADGVVVVLEAEGHGLALEDEGAADASADGYGPALAAGGVPVGGDAGGGAEGPSFAEVVVNKVLPEKVVGAWGAVGVRQGRELDEEGAEDPGARGGEKDDGGSHGPSACFGWICGGGGEGEGRTNSPDDLAGVRWG